MIAQKTKLVLLKIKEQMEQKQKLRYNRRKVFGNRGLTFAESPERIHLVPGKTDIG